MKQFTTGTKVFLDFNFGAKPKATVLEVLVPGNGKDIDGKVRVKLTETVGAYRKGEVLEVGTFRAVPCCMERKLNPGEFFRRVSTLYEFGN